MNKSIKIKTKSIKIKTKTVKRNKSTMKKCEHFCKKDYIPEMAKINDKRRKEEKNPLAIRIYGLVDKYKTKAKNIEYDGCKKTYCNEKCEGYNFNGDTKFQKKFLKTIKNGFVDSYSSREIKMLKKRGASSGCWKVGKSYDYGYDIFHK
jgi:hypothetical protein